MHDIAGVTNIPNFDDILVVHLALLILLHLAQSINWFTQKHKHLDSYNNIAQSFVWSTNTASSKPLQLLLHETSNLVIQEINTNSSINKSLYASA